MRVAACEGRPRSKRMRVSAPKARRPWCRRSVVKGSMPPHSIPSGGKRHGHAWQVCGVGDYCSGTAPDRQGPHKCQTQPLKPRPPPSSVEIEKGPHLRRS